jgi:hypothetical protein
VNWSAGLGTLVPNGVATVTATVPLPAGETAVIELSELTVKVAAFTAPNLTALTSLNSAPVIVTEVPPNDGPACGVTVTGPMATLRAYQVVGCSSPLAL